jgi:hypothetical protein
VFSENTLTKCNNLISTSCGFLLFMPPTRLQYWQYWLLYMKNELVFFFLNSVHSFRGGQALFFHTLPALFCYSEEVRPRPLFCHFASAILPVVRYSAKTTLSSELYSIMFDFLLQKSKGIGK